MVHAAPTLPGDTALESRPSRAQDGVGLALRLGKRDAVGVGVQVNDVGQDEGLGQAGLGCCCGGARGPSWAAAAREAAGGAGQLSWEYKVLRGKGSTAHPLHGFQAAPPGRHCSGDAAAVSFRPADMCCLLRQSAAAGVPRLFSSADKGLLARCTSTPGPFGMHHRHLTRTGMHVPWVTPGAIPVRHRYSQHGAVTVSPGAVTFHRLGMAIVACSVWSLTCSRKASGQRLVHLFFFFFHLERRQTYSFTPCVSCAYKQYRAKLRKATAIRTGQQIPSANQVMLAPFGRPVAALGGGTCSSAWPRAGELHQILLVCAHILCHVYLSRKKALRRRTAGATQFGCSLGAFLVQGSCTPAGPSLRHCC